MKSIKPETQGEVQKMVGVVAQPMHQRSPRGRVEVQRRERVKRFMRDFVQKVYLFRFYPVGDKEPTVALSSQRTIRKY